MAVDLRPMTVNEFVVYEAADIHRYADEMVKAGFWSPDTALERSKETHARLLPDGVETKDHLFFVIGTSQAPSPVGAIWRSIDRQKTPPSGFIYDLLVHQPFRGRGFGRQAMLALEDQARRLGLGSLDLHVFEENAPAKSLYTSLGYVIRGVNITKALPIWEEKGDA